MKCSYEHLELGLYHFWFISYSQAIFLLNFRKYQSQKWSIFQKWTIF